MTAPTVVGALPAAARVAQRILDGSVSLIAGAREISRLASGYVGRPNLDAAFEPFVIFDDRTFDLPVGRAREQWAPEALAEKDAQLATIEREMRDELLDACRSLVARLGSDP
jgi:hypothetical protein